MIRVNLICFKDDRSWFEHIREIDCTQSWPVVAITLTNILETASVLHVLVLVYLRFISIRNPLENKGNLVIKLRRVLIIVIWTITSVAQIGGLFADYIQDYELSSSIHISVISLMILVLGSVVIMNYLLVRTLQGKKLEQQTSNSTNYNHANYDGRGCRSVRWVVGPVRTFAAW